MVSADDDSVVEAAMHKGNSSSEKLFDLVARLRQAELQFSRKILVTHVACTRIIAQDTDGVSRGSLKEGVDVGGGMIKVQVSERDGFSRSKKRRSSPSTI